MTLLTGCCCWANLIRGPPTETSGRQLAAASITVVPTARWHRRCLPCHVRAAAYCRPHANGRCLSPPPPPTAAHTLMARFLVLAPDATFGSSGLLAASAIVQFRLTLMAGVSCHHRARRLVRLQPEQPGTRLIPHGSVLHERNPILHENVVRFGPAWNLTRPISPIPASKWPRKNP